MAGESPGDLARPGTSVTSPDGSDQLPPQRASSTHPKGSGNRGGASRSSENGWIDAQGHWAYLKWRNEARSPVTHDAMVKTITELQANMTGEIIHRFKSKQPMWAIEEEGHSQAVFDLEISLRSTTADEVHMNFGVLMGNAFTNLVGMTMKRDDRPRQPQAQQLAQMVYPDLLPTAYLPSLRPD